MKGSKSAARAQKRAQEAALKAQEAANNLQANYAADLKTDQVAQVVAGGSAEVADIDLAQKKRKANTGSLSSQLGILQ